MIFLLESDSEFSDLQTEKEVDTMAQAIFFKKESYDFLPT